MNEIEAWARELAAMEPMEPALYEPPECIQFLENWVAACADAPRLLDTLGPAAENFFCVAMYSVEEVVWREDIPLALCESAIKTSLPMISAFCGRTGNTLLPGMFWMLVLEKWDVILKRDVDHRLLPTVKATLLEQVRRGLENPCLRDSAWEGIRLIDEQLAAEAKAIEAAMGL